MMKVCLVSHGHPAANPRMVREADALSGAGYEVLVVTPRFVERWVPFDNRLAAQAAWRYQFVDFLREHGRSWSYVRARRRLCEALSAVLPAEGILGRACNYANPELARMAAAGRADLYVAHQHHALPAAAWAAERAGSRFAFDAQDLLADSSAEPRHLIRSLERRYLSRCAYITTMSDAAAQRLQETNGLPAPALVLHNTPRLVERAGIAPPHARASSRWTSIYWFGQTIGPHSRAEQVLRALPLVESSVRLVLRGAAAAPYVDELRRLAARLGVQERLSILPLESPDRMVALSAEHDVMLGSQPGSELFHQMAIGNKVFTGMMAGLALALTDTIAHRDLVANAPGCGFLFPDEDHQRLAKILTDLLREPGALRRMQESSWAWAEREFNWEHESRRHLSMIAGLGLGRGGTK